MSLYLEIATSRRKSRHNSKKKLKTEDADEQVSGVQGFKSRRTVVIVNEREKNQDEPAEAAEQSES